MHQLPAILVRCAHSPSPGLATKKTSAPDVVLLAGSNVFFCRRYAVNLAQVANLVNWSFYSHSRISCEAAVNRHDYAIDET